MTAADAFDYISRICFGLGIPGAIVWFVRDRRKSRAETKVVERTVGAEVKIRDVAAVEANLALVERAFTVERESKDRQISNLDGQVKHLAEMVADRDEQIAELRDEVSELKMQVNLLTNLTRRLTHEVAPPDEIGSHFPDRRTGPAEYEGPDKRAPHMPEETL